MKIGIDFHGTIANEIPERILFFRERGIEITPENCNRRTLKAILGEEEGTKLWNEAANYVCENPEVYERIEPFLGTKEFLEELRNKGHRIVVITSSTYVTRANVENFLKEHEIPFDNLFSTGLEFVNGKRIHRRPKDYLVKKFGIDVLIDDTYWFLTPLSGNGKLLLYMRRPYNLDLNPKENDIISINGWDDARDRIRDYEEAKKAMQASHQAVENYLNT